MFCRETICRIIPVITSPGSRLRAPRPPGEARRQDRLVRDPVGGGAQEPEAPALHAPVLCRDRLPRRPRLPCIGHPLAMCPAPWQK